MSDQSPERWTFLSHHGHVVHCLAVDPDARIRDIADRVGITERSTHSIIKDLESAGYIVVVKQGRRNHYMVRGELKLRHPLECHCPLSRLLSSVSQDAEQA